MRYSVKGLRAQVPTSSGDSCNRSAEEIPGVGFPQSIARLLDGLRNIIHKQPLIKGLLDELMLRFNQCEIRDMAYLREPVPFVPDGKDVQVGRDDLLTSIDFLGKKGEKEAASSRDLLR